MKKIYAALLVMATFTLNVQSKAQKGFSISVIGTPQFSSLQNSSDKDSSSVSRTARFNTSFGVGAAYNFTEKAGIGLDVLYSLQGQRYEKNGKETEQKQNYVKIPVYFLYTGNASRSVSFLGKIGPQLSILASSELTSSNGNNTTTDTKDRYKTVTFGGMAGAGTQFRLNPNLFLTTLARFDYDFTNAEDKDHMHWSMGREKTHNLTIGLEVGLKFLLQ